MLGVRLLQGSLGGFAPCLDFFGVPKWHSFFEFGDWLRGASRGCVGAVPRVGIDSAVFGAVGPGSRKVDTSGVSYAAWVSVAELSASKSSGARRLH